MTRPREGADSPSPYKAGKGIIKSDASAQPKALAMEKNKKSLRRLTRLAIWLAENIH